MVLTNVTKEVITYSATVIGTIIGTIYLIFNGNQLINALIRFITIFNKPPKEGVCGHTCTSAKQMVTIDKEVCELRSQMDKVNKDIHEIKDEVQEKLDTSEFDRKWNEMYKLITESNKQGNTILEKLYTIEARNDITYKIVERVLTNISIKN